MQQTLIMTYSTAAMAGIVLRAWQSQRWAGHEHGSRAEQGSRAELEGVTGLSLFPGMIA